jgi:GNAT superfamily N-acetyltransferase
MSDEFVYASPLDPRARPLIEDLTYEYDSRYGDFFERDGAIVEMNRYAPEVFAPPHGNFLLLIRDGEAIAGGAFMRHGERTAEFKRIWTRRDLRRQGLARKLLIELEAQALRQGYARIYLTTGYDALFDVNSDLELIRHLAFEKRLAPAAASNRAAE